MKVEEAFHAMKGMSLAERNAALFYLLGAIGATIDLNQISQESIEVALGGAVQFAAQTEGQKEVA